MSNITVRVNNETGKLVYWPKLRKLGLPGKFSLLPVSKIDQIIWTYPPGELTGAKNCGIITVAAEGAIYSYSFFAGAVGDVEEIIHLISTARQLEKLMEDINR